MPRSFLFLLLLLFVSSVTIAQTCTELGQNPSTAFPVCGTSTFGQTTVPICGGKRVAVVTKCAGSMAPYTDINPYWYKFTCFQAGTLGFTILPNVLQEDYDWQLYDITGHDPSEVYTNSSLIIACNWSGDFGPTGTSQNASAVMMCDGPGIPLYSSMPVLIQGHNYLLLVSHFTITQSGYSLTFGGGTAVITDTTKPHMASASASCDNKQIRIKLNKKMKCSSLSADGSEFAINTPGFSVIAASSYQCSSSFDMDSVEITLNKALQPGNYLLVVKNGNDSNTIVDNCNNGIDVNESVPIIITPPHAAELDSIAPVGCAPSTLQLVFSTPVLCSTVEPGGTDLVISGPTPVTIAGAAANCVNGLTDHIQVNLSSPIKIGGTYTIRAKIGSDGNTMTNECGMQMPVGSSISFTANDTVNADFSYRIKYGCKIDSVFYSHDGNGQVNSWVWNFDDKIKSNLQSPVIPYTLFGTRTTSLIVSNGVCSDTSSQLIILNNELKAAFETNTILCPNELATFKDESLGNIISWNWNFGNGNTSTLQHPDAQSYITPAITTTVRAKLLIIDSIGCKDSTTASIVLANNCYIAVPSAFTPNSDGLNDYLYPLNAYKTINLTFKVFNRYGQLVFETNDWTVKWDGKFNGQPANAGTYVWFLQYTDTDTGQKHFSKGTSILIR
ncbi:T9SS type B sorting domain-containing protein [Ferruginibacter albus]|uniref:T9SS type B sorting domain-containing protein n=1 Tax=Ferruginibacter albus TaxID=2875540 RepID=UPI001CC42583|nr:gliding motility-associated C-terminal domain-containing protein [Ferruginibacter albus]UAY53542.1 gliding motility-associated C-terminal domain-containing protein [Ferruginibacter albus]